MKTVALLVCGLLAVVQGRTIDKHDVYKPRVINGEEAQLGERPYQVALETSHGPFCGGSIINEYWVLTAAHCVSSKLAYTITVAVGSISIWEPYSLHDAVEIRIHENYTPSDSYKNDIALIKVATPFVFSFRLQPVTLPEPFTKVKTNSSAVVSGWGYTSDSNLPDKLQKAAIYITDPEVCQAAVQPSHYNIYPTHVCTNHPNSYRGECNGDSGGPVTVDDVLTGIVSWSIKDDGCASPRFPGVHTRVSEYIDWINQYTK